MKLIIYFIFFSFIFFNSFIPSNKEPKSKIELGEMLFFDKSLSSSNDISCASCHIPEFAFSDTIALSKGVNGRLGSRNAPSCMNMNARTTFFYDGRANSLELQARGPLTDHNEMNLPLYDVTSKVQKNPRYVKYFKAIYHQKPNIDNITNAISEFERSLETTSRFDDYMQGDSTAISESAKRGHELFLSSKTKCFDCHFSPDFTGDEFKNIGLFNGKDLNDSGRYLVSKDKLDIGKFKTPGLRNVGITGPYMHNGMFKSIKEVLAFYNNPDSFINNSIGRDTSIKALNLTNEELQDLENFINSLTDSRFLKKK